MNTTGGNIFQYCALYSFDYVLENLLRVIEITHTMPPITYKITITEYLYISIYIISIYVIKDLCQVINLCLFVCLFVQPPITLGVIGDTHQSCLSKFQPTRNLQGVPKKLNNKLFRLWTLFWPYLTF